MFSHVNWGLLACMAALFFIGLANLYSASGTRTEEEILVSSFYQKQIIWGICGVCCLLLTLSFDYRRLRNFAWPFYWITLFLLILVAVAGKNVYGATRWISLGSFSLQPSELAKIAVLVLGARLLSGDGQPLGWKRFGAILFMALVPCGLILHQPDLGTTMMLLLIIGGMILFHGMRASVLRSCLVAIPLAGVLLWFVGMHDYQRQRILSFLDPSNDPRGTGYHILQSRIAIGSGQIWGKGFTEGTQSQLRFLPERHSDFALAVFGEEWGFIGCVALVSLFCLFLLSIFSSAIQAKDRFGSMLVVGIFFYFFWEIFINICMVIGLMPVVGIPLPFISYGGSAMLVNFTLLGVVLNVSMRRFMFKG